MGTQQNGHHPAEKRSHNPQLKNQSTQDPKAIISSTVSKKFGLKSFVKSIVPLRIWNKKSPAAVDASETLLPYPRERVPRLAFEGRYFTNPSTVNNDIRHYDVDNFRPSYQMFEDSENRNGWWNPDGYSSFYFVDCKVTSTVKKEFDPLPLFAPVDTLVGNRLCNVVNTVHGKISDLDPQMQMASTLYGVAVNLQYNDGTENIGFSGILQPTAFRDIMFSDNRISAVYQGVVKLDSFNVGHARSSVFLNKCEPFVQASKLYEDPNDSSVKPFPNGALSIRFRVDNYDQGTYFGDTVGTIQPWTAGQPLNFDAGRKLHITSAASDSGINFAYCHVQQTSSGTSLYVDLLDTFDRANGNSIDIGHVYVVYFDPEYVPGKTDNSHVLGEVLYRAPGFDSRGCVAEIPLSEAQIIAISNKPVGLIAVPEDTSGDPIVLLAESNDGAFMRADIFTYRLDPGDAKKMNIHFYATIFGQRASLEDAVIGFDSLVMETTGGTGTDFPPPATPMSALTINGDTPVRDDATDTTPFKTTVTLDSNGFASVPLIGGEINKPRGYIDGQIYGLRFNLGDELPELDREIPSSDRVNVLLFDHYTAPPNPSWVGDVMPIFKQYANLYPAMHRIVRLDDYGSVMSRRDALIHVFSVPVDDPMYMPTNRDLSAAKREMILNFLTGSEEVNGAAAEGSRPEPIFMNNTLEDLKKALQIAVELEHATIPPYLTTLYTIKRGTNRYIADTIRDVAIDEMLHMGILCNIMTAIGFSPKISQMSFVPKFPGPLPGGLRPGFIAHLRKLSKTQLKMFMDLEMPDSSAIPEDGDVSNGSPVKTSKYTIGWLYDAIIDALTTLKAEGVINFPGLGADPNNPHVANQVDGYFNGQLTKILTLDQAKEGIEKIKEQGEGSSSLKPFEMDEADRYPVLDPDTGLPLLSHYYRFAEIVKGRRIVVDKDENGEYTSGFSYTGPKIRIDEEGVYSMQDDPQLQNQPIGSAQRDRMTAFGEKYRAMLRALEKSWSGHPDYLATAISMMYQLPISAEPLMALPALDENGNPKEDGTTCGISFQMPFED